MTIETKDEESSSSWWEMACTSRVAYILFAVIAGLALIGIGFVFGNDLLAMLVGMRSWFLEEGIFGIMTFIFIFFVNVALFFPGSPIAISAGFIFGVVNGVCVLLLCYVFSSALLLFLGRVVFRDFFIEMLRHDELFNRLRGRLGEFEVGAKLNVLLCFFPMPFAIHVHIFAVTDFPAATFIASFIPGLLPGTILLVLCGRSIYKIGFSEGLKGMEDTEALLLLVGIGAAALVIFYCGMIVRKTIDEIANETNTPTAAADDKGYSSNAAVEEGMKPTESSHLLGGVRVKV